MTDSELLRQYLHEGSQDAFTQLVRRHVDVVYSAARRQARGDAHLAEEITQQVFILLAQKAKTLSDDVLLGGWLYNAARFVARDQLRKAENRARHEQKAAAMAQQSRSAASDTGKRDAWDDAEDILDEAMSDLDEPTRGLLVLRYFEGKNAHEVAARLGISEEAARKRISRALDELRNMFAHRGVSVTTAILADAILAKSIIQAPAHLAASATSAATRTTATLAKTGTILMAASTTKLTAAVIVAVIFIALIGGGIAAVRYFTPPRTHTINLADQHPTITGPKITGQVLAPDGSPAANCEIRVGVSGKKQVEVYSTAGRPDAFSDSTGHFQAPKPAAAYVLSIRSPQGYCEISSQALAQGTPIQLQPRGRIEGIIKAGDQVIPHATVMIWRVGQNGEAVHHETGVVADAHGHFIFEQVIPGGTQMFYRFVAGNIIREAYPQYVDVQPGKTTVANIGGGGFSVVGRLLPAPGVADMGWNRKDGEYEASLRPQKRPQPLKHDPNETPEEYRAKEEAYARTPEGKFYNTWMFGSALEINPDGSFRIDNLPPGDYFLSVRSFEVDPQVHFADDSAHAEKQFTIPATASSKPIDLGTIPSQAIPHLHPGDPAPEFSVTTTDGNTISSANLKGKPFIIIFWGTYSNTDRLKPFGDFYAKWKNDPRVNIIGCYLAPDDQTAKAQIAKDHLDFPQVKESEYGTKLLKKFDSSWPAAVLIGSDGKVIQKYLQGDTLEKILAKTLPSSPATQR